MKVLCKHAESHGSGGSQATGQVLGMSVDRALDILVEHAAGELGFSPRDVYDAVFRPDLSEQEHTNPMAQVNYSKLESYISQFRESKSDPDSPSHQVITVDHIQSDLFKIVHVAWEMNFKSPQIARKAVEHLRREEMNHLRKMFRLFKGFFYGDSLAGWIFEAMVHRKFYDGWQQSDRSPQYIPMRTHLNENPRGPPAFSTDPFDGTDRSPRPAPLSPNGKEFIDVDLGRSGLPQDVTLDEHRYYRPAADNDPLFDSFTVHHDGGSTFVITTIGITISEKHRGSKNAYLHIHKIMGRVKELAHEEHSDPKVRVVYCLICPEGNTRNVWALPDGWTESTGDNDHCGEAFYLRMPFSRTLCLSDFQPG